MSVCPKCGKEHEQPWGAICDLVEGRSRVEALCPYHKQPEPAERFEYYDTRRDFFDCGSFVDYGYGVSSEPIEVTRKRWRDQKRAYRARQAAKR